jgi:hypothetical protein
MQMMNLEDMGLISLSKLEQINIDGGEVILQDPEGYGNRAAKGMHLISDFVGGLFQGVWDAFTN